MHHRGECYSLARWVTWVRKNDEMELTQPRRGGGAWAVPCHGATTWGVSCHTGLPLCHVVLCCVVLCCVVLCCPELASASLPFAL